MATEVVEAAGSNPDALEDAMMRFERATAAMDRVGGWDAETFAQQVWFYRRVPLLKWVAFVTTLSPFRLDEW